VLAGSLGGAIIFRLYRMAAGLLSWREIGGRLDTVPTGGYVGGQNLRGGFCLGS
jgi:hypothetical protein